MAHSRRLPGRNFPEIHILTLTGFYLYLTALMICDICKERKAGVFLSRMTGSKKKEFSLCFQCAAGFGLPSEDSEKVTEAVNKIEEFMAEKENGIPSESGRVCPVCGKSLRQVLRSEEAGCPECYHCFSAEITEFMRRRKIPSGYAGELPARLKNFRSRLTDRIDIRTKLDDAVLHEEYEKAAFYRDYLTILERKDTVSGSDSGNLENS